MKNLFSSIFILLISLVLLVSCKSRKPVEPEKITDIRFIKEIVRDTVLTVKADSTFYDAWIECINGKPVLKEPKKQEPVPHKPESPKALQKPKVNLDENGKLTVECYKEVETIKAQLTDKYERLLREHQKTVYIEKDLTWYQKSLMWMGVAFLAFIVLVIILKIKNLL
jgi:hypothetical protein